MRAITTVRAEQSFASTNSLNHVHKCKFSLEDINHLEQELESMRIRLSGTHDTDRLVELQQSIEALKRKIQAIKDKQLQPF